MEEEVKVRFPDGRVNWLPIKTARSREVVQMGGVILEEVVKVPKRFTPIVEDEPISDVQDAPVVETNDAAEVAVKKTRKPRGPNKKKKA